MNESTCKLTQLEFSEKDFEIAEQMAARLGYTQTAYTGTSALWGLYCINDNAKQPSGCIIRTKELGLMFVQTNEDLHFDDLFQMEISK